MKSFSDIFKKSFMEGNAVDLQIPNVLMALISSFLCGMIIYFIYRKFYKGIIYNNNFNILLVLVSLITTFIVITISSNVVLSLGMVGALSIVRFRTAVKDPLDVGFLFWAISIGITCGAGLYFMSFLSTFVIAVIYVLLITYKNTARVYLLIVKFKNEANEDVQKILVNVKHVLKNKTVLGGKTELTVEVKAKVDNTSFVTLLSEVEGVYSAALVEYTGDFGE
ncbi:DUF4956 domain-containing protein [Mobilitalea sibirica]|uniref:DUF4956 domain-containing protein n=1 Tax=Mobilitalea sibirica TaxID=1462919 RepID=A0A8J7L034_9FIRM|nr:DUF4956 domain-containing protein [Mobilitalea sibirica]MBH1941523.1 DUF4956 domain-containing protein [Mobilitalea sibirica]